VTQFANVS